MMMMQLICQEYWQKKRERNIKHDQEVTTMLEARSWKVLRIWECELKLKNRKQLIEKIQKYIFAL